MVSTHTWVLLTSFVLLDTVYSAEAGDCLPEDLPLPSWYDTLLCIQYQSICKGSLSTAPGVTDLVDESVNCWKLRPCKYILCLTSAREVVVVFGDDSTFAY